MEVQDLGDGLIYLGMVAGALATIGVVLRFAVVRPLQKWLREQIKPDLTAVHAEVTPNHGQSLNDKITRIDDRLTDHLINHPGGSA